MYTFKSIDKSSTVIERNVVNYRQNFTTSSLGISSINIVSGSINNNHWSSLNNLFYTSGSPVYNQEDKFVLKNLSLKLSHGKQFLTKYHGYSSSSLLSIPQKYYGEQIKKSSFKLIDKSFTDNAGNNPTIIDDGFGNLYALNANSNFGTLTASSAGENNSISSSENYIGNIFYDKGIAVITETGSWSGSVKYSDITKGTNFTLQFDSTDTITTHEYSVTLNPSEFNKSMNYTLRMPLSGTFSTVNELTASSVLGNPYYASQFTGSDFTPYITTINLYNRDDNDTPVMVAKLPKPIRKSNKISTTFKIRLDI
tara:strand:- start:197 stop:1129 length:933 start_codon:yes stop_codon:yes gene_type:complete